MQQPAVVFYEVTQLNGINARLRQIADLFKVSIVDMFSSDFTGLKSDDTFKIEELSEKLHQRESLLVDLQMKLLQYYEKKPTVDNIVLSHGVVIQPEQG
jgi:hypothetical protein